MPALTIPSPTDTRSTSPEQPSTHTEEHDTSRSRSQSPGRPPVSPITPTVSAARLAPTVPPEPRPHVVPPPLATFRQQPPSVPISESENPDAIALRSAISLLQLQREKSKRDLKTLQELKNVAVTDPHGFVRSLQAQRARTPQGNTDALTPTLSDAYGPIVNSGDATEDGSWNGEERADSADAGSAPGLSGSRPDVPTLPQPQNIVRCPPVNWAKYHVVGESLDKLHNEQQKYPGSSEPPRTHQGIKAPPHAVAAPYSPFTDGVGESHSSRARQGSKKSKSPS